ncbi:hypothetical protein RND81_14G228500 [Saponaria officinalis]|uniref:Uncharacterized protein n=1 Tax=Saponaria officinalis TaxID=3572 RepID=A0AAW1H0Z1_SAPOF
MICLLLLLYNTLGLSMDRISDPNWDFGSDIQSENSKKLISNIRSDFLRISDIQYPKISEVFESDI